MIDTLWVPRLDKIRVLPPCLLSHVVVDVSSTVFLFFLFLYYALFALFYYTTYARPEDFM